MSNKFELEILNPNIKTDTPIGKMMLTMISAVYEMELEQHYENAHNKVEN